MDKNGPNGPKEPSTANAPKISPKMGKVSDTLKKVIVCDSDSHQVAVVHDDIWLQLQLRLLIFLSPLVNNLGRLGQTAGQSQRKSIRKLSISPQKLRLEKQMWIWLKVMHIVHVYNHYAFGWYAGMPIFRQPQASLEREATSSQRLSAFVHFAACTQQLSKVLYRKALGLKNLEAMSSIACTDSIHWSWPKLPIKELNMMTFASMATCAMEAMYKADLPQELLRPALLLLLWVLRSAPTVTSSKVTADDFIISRISRGSCQASAKPSQAFTA